jgi:hypothetical protein
MDPGLGVRRPGVHDREVATLSPGRVSHIRRIPGSMWRGHAGAVSWGSLHRVALAAGISASLLLGCGSPREAQPAFSVSGVPVVVETTAPFASSADFPARVEDTLRVALRYWGGEWSNLRDVSITFSSEARVKCAGDGSALGCFDGDIHLTTSDPGAGPYHCVEQTALVHEVGHAVIGDPTHEDPRWMELEPVRDALSGRVGYGEAGPTDCAIAVSVWRHLRHRP